MRNLTPSLVAIHRDLAADDDARRRIDAMMEHIRCDDVREVDDAGLVTLCRERWQQIPRWGTLTAAAHDPDIVFNRFRLDDSPEERARRLALYPELGERALNGYGSVTWRDDGNIRKTEGAVCTSAWELHSIHGCVFRCAYCTFGGIINIAANVEQQIRPARRVDGAQHLPDALQVG